MNIARHIESMFSELYILSIKMGRPRIHPKEDEAEIRKIQWALEAHRILHPEHYESANASFRFLHRAAFDGKL